MIREIYLRLKSKTPIFFKRIQKLFIALGVLGTSISAYGEALGFLPDWITPLCLGCGCLGAFLTQLTVVNPDELNK